MLQTKDTREICWICYSNGDLTGEHKIKRTDIQKDGPFPRYVEIKGQRKELQSPKAKLLKFPKSICAECNGHISQKSDRAYEEFRNLYTNDFLRILSGRCKKIALQEKDEPSNWDIDMFRYFAKHLGSVIDYNTFPVPVRLSKFVSHNHDQRCVDVEIRNSRSVYEDPETKELSAISGFGKVVYLSDNKWTFNKATYQTAFMNGGLQFIIRMQLSRLESFEVSARLYLQGKRTQEVLSDEIKVNAGIDYDDQQLAAKPD